MSLLVGDRVVADIEYVAKLTPITIVDNWHVIGSVRGNGVDLRISKANFAALVNHLHAQMLVLRSQLGAATEWGWLPLESPVTPGMINNACRSDSELLDWVVYEAILTAANASRADVNMYQLLHETITDARPYRHTTVSQHPPELRHLHRLLAAITTEAEFMRHLRDLVEQRGLALRAVVQKMYDLNPRHAIGRSTLSDWLHHSRLPSNRAGFEALLQTVLPDYPVAAMLEPVRLYMARYDVLRGAAINSGSEPDAGVERNADYWRAKYEQAERARSHTRKMLKEAQQVIAGYEDDRASTGEAEHQRPGQTMIA